MLQKKTKKAEKNLREISVFMYGVNFFRAKNKIRKKKATKDRSD
jgi:hypothetical protein